MSTVHCWKGELEWIEERYGDRSDEYFNYFANDVTRTCLLPEGHDGDHEWTNDTNIVIRFKGTVTPATANRKESR